MILVEKKPGAISITYIYEPILLIAPEAIVAIKIEVYSYEDHFWDLKFLVQ